MPLPIIIPIAIGAVTLVGGLTATKHGSDRIKRAQAHHQQEYDAYANQHQHTVAAQQEIDEHYLPLLGQMRLDAMAAVREAIKLANQAVQHHAHALPDSLHDELVELKNSHGVYDSLLDQTTLPGSTLATQDMAQLGASGPSSAINAISAAGTGAAISGLGSLYAAKAGIAWLGGGTLVASGAGIAGGAVLLGGLAAGPLLAMGVLKEIKAGRVEKEVEIEVDQLHRQMNRLTAQRERMDKRLFRIGELQGTLDRKSRALARYTQKLDLTQAEAPEALHQLAIGIRELQQLINEPVH